MPSTTPPSSIGLIRNVNECICVCVAKEGRRENERKYAIFCMGFCVSITASVQIANEALMNQRSYVTDHVSPVWQTKRKRNILKKK